MARGGQRRYGNAGRTAYRHGTPGAQSRAVFAAAGGGPVTPGVPVRTLGQTTTTKDGSVGQTYTAPAGMTGIQWHREVLTSDRAKTAIAGANASTYVTQQADSGSRMVARGTLNGVLTDAAALQVVFPVPVLLESFDAVTGFTTSVANNPTIAIDNANKVQGTGSLVATSAGAGNRLMKVLGALTDKGLATPADLGTVVWSKEELAPYTMSNTSGSLRLDVSTGTPSSSGELAGANSFGAHKGRTILKANFGALAYLQAKDPTSPNWKMSYDRSATGSTPYAQVSRIDCLIAHGQRRSTVGLGFDDGYSTQFLNAWPEMKARGIRGTFYLPTDIIDAGTGSSRMNWPQVSALFADGADLQIDGRGDDGAMTSLANPAAAVAELLRQRSRVMSMVPGSDPRHFCYPNGYTDKATAVSNDPSIDFRAYAGAATATANSPVLTGLTATANIAQGMAVGGVGIPAGARVASVDSASQITLTTNVVAANAFPIAVWDDGDPFFNDKLQDAIRADGTFKTGRTTVNDDFMSAYGFGNRDLLMPANSISNGAAGNLTDAQLAAQALARVDTAIANGTTIIFYIHGVFDGATFINTPLTNTFIPFLDGLKARRDAGSCDILPINQIWARDGGASFPL